MVSDANEIEKDLTLLAKSSIFVFVAIFISKLFMYLYRIVIARYYTPEIYGIFSLAFMITGFFVAFASLGFYEGILRFIPYYRSKQKEDKIKYLINFSKRILLISSLLSTFFLFFSSDFIAINFFHNIDLAFYLKVFAFLIPVQIFGNFHLGIIRSYEKIKTYSFGMNILQNLSKFVFILFFILIGINSNNAIATSYFIGVFSGLIFAYLYCRIKIPKIFTKYYFSKKEKSEVRNKFFSYSWPLILFSIIGTLMFWIDTLLVGYFKDAYWVGIYNAAVPIALLLIFASEIFMQLFFPLITREFTSKNFIVVRELSKQVTKWIFMINLPITILILLFPGVFINLFFGAEYLLAVNALRFLALGQFMYSIASVSSNMLLSSAKSRIILVNLIIASLINLILNIILIPTYGIDGAAMATFISFSFLSIVIISENYYLNKIFPFRRKMLSIFLISLVLSSGLYYLSNFFQVGILQLSIFGILFILIYLILIFLTKSFDKNDLMILKKILRKN